MKVEQIYNHNILKNYSYVLYNEDSSNAWCIDPYSDKLVSNFLLEKGLNLKMVINTHGHADHTKGNQALMTRWSANLYDLPGRESIVLDNGYKLVTHYLPGHRGDHVCFILEREGQQLGFFSGDLILPYGIGNIKNGGNIIQMHESLQKVLELVEDSTIFYSGHDYAQSNLKFSKSILEDDVPCDDGTFGHQKRHNIFLKLNDKIMRSRVSDFSKIELSSSLDYLTYLRRKRDSW